MQIMFKQQIMGIQRFDTAFGDSKNRQVEIYKEIFYLRKRWGLHAYVPCWNCFTSRLERRELASMNATFTAWKSTSRYRKCVGCQILSAVMAWEEKILILTYHLHTGACLLAHSMARWVDKETGLFSKSIGCSFGCCCVPSCDRQAITWSLLDF